MPSLREWVLGCYSCLAKPSDNANTQKAPPLQRRLCMSLSPLSHSWLYPQSLHRFGTGAGFDGAGVGKLCA